MRRERRTGGISEPANQLHRDRRRDPLARVMRREEQHVGPRRIIRRGADLYGQDRTPFVGRPDRIDMNERVRRRP